MAQEDMLTRRLPAKYRVWQSRRLLSPLGTNPRQKFSLPPSSDFLSLPRHQPPPHLRLPSPFRMAPLRAAARTALIRFSAFRTPNRRALLLLSLLLSLTNVSPSVGSLRFRLPRSPLNYPGVQNATAYSQGCPQLPLQAGLASPLVPANLTTIIETSVSCHILRPIMKASRD